MNTNLYIHILFPAELQPDDIDILAQPTADKAGQAHLQTAYTGPARPDTPNSLPLLSRSGASIGYVAHTRFLEAPYEESYVIR